MQNEEIINAEIGGTFTPAPSGVHAFVCVGLYVLGNIDSSFNGHPKKEKKLILAFELVNTNHVFKEGSAPEPFIVHKEFTHSLHEQANLRKMLGAWRGTAFTDAECKVYNIYKILGGAGSLNILHESKDGKTQAKIASFLQAIPNTPEARTPKRYYNVGKQPFDKAAFDAMPAWIQKKAITADEYKALNLPPVTTAAATSGTVSKDNIPF